MTNKITGTVVHRKKDWGIFIESPFVENKEEAKKKRAWLIKKLKDLKIIEGGENDYK